MSTPDALDYAELDPAIRETVRRLRAAGFTTTDSGDGATKLAAGWPADEVIAHPHVFIVTEPEQLVAEARRLREVLAVAGVEVVALAPDGAGVSIQASYDPVGSAGVIMLTGLDDQGWPVAAEPAAAPAPLPGPPPAPPPLPRAYYFGPWGRPGHGLHHVGGRDVRREDRVPFDPFDNAFWLDGGLAPRRLGLHEVYGTGKRAGEVYFVMDGRDEDQRARLRRGGEELPQGQFLLHRFRGHTLIAWWDRTQGDERGACNSVFIVEGDHRSADEMIALWARCFPRQAANLDRAGVQLVEARP